MMKVLSKSVYKYSNIKKNTEISARGEIFIYYKIKQWKRRKTREMILNLNRILLLVVLLFMVSDLRSAEFEIYNTATPFGYC